LGGDDPRAGLTAAVVWHLIEIRVLTFALGIDLPAYSDPFWVIIKSLFLEMLID